MSLIDKLKNVFFEEVPDDEDEEELPQSFAKKVEIPKKPVDIPKKNIEIPKRDTLQEEKTIEEETVEEETIAPPNEIPVNKEEKEFPMMFDDEDFLEDKRDVLEEKPLTETGNDYQSLKRESREYDDDNLYQGKKEMSYVESVNSRKSSTITSSYYENREIKGFRPSPIISPIYGILDKNYRKEEVVTKKETKVVTTNYGKPDLDSIRNKAFGNENTSRVERKRSYDDEDHSKEESEKIYDVNNNKPQVKKVTLADADEYYNDLGLAYNVDYSDASRNTETRSSRYNKDKKKNKSVDDNLFDLIDSMYNKED